MMPSIKLTHLRPQALYAALLILALTATTLSSCHSSKNITATPTAPTGDCRQRLDQLTATYSPWTVASVPVELKLKEPMNVSVGGKATMERDKSVYMSFRFLGLEVLNLYVTSDSIFGAYKMDKIYVAESLDKLLGDFPITVANLQDMLMGRPFIAGQDYLTPSMVSNSQMSTGADNNWYISPAKVRGVAYTFDIAGNTSLRSLTVSTGGSSTPVTATYAAPRSTLMGSFSPQVSVVSTIGKSRLNVALEWNLSKAKWEGVETKTWKVPKGYRRVSAEALISSFSTK